MTEARRPRRTRSGSTPSRETISYASVSHSLCRRSSSSRINDSSSSTFRRPITVAYYQDILTRNAFGNYRELLEEITYSPAMAYYLTYMRNQKESASSNRMPDENYAREIMQLFTIGLNELNQDGTVKLGADGEPIPTFDNGDVTGLAKVFTGLAPDTGDFDEYNRDIPEAYEARPLVVYPNYHSSSEKSFLGTTIPAGTSGEESIDIALDTLFQHPNLAPFLSRQMIQRLVTSDPSARLCGTRRDSVRDGSVYASRRHERWRWPPRLSWKRWLPPF
jgi:uncharacterized protein (DUF1800 family)